MECYRCHIDMTPRKIEPNTAHAEYADEFDYFYCRKCKTNFASPKNQNGEEK